MTRLWEIEASASVLSASVLNANSGPSPNMPGMFRFLPRPATPLGREIAGALVLKAVAILVLWMAFFSPSDRPAVDQQVMERVILDRR